MDVRRPPPDPGGAAAAAAAAARAAIVVGGIRDGGRAGSFIAGGTGCAVVGRAGDGDGTAPGSASVAEKTASVKPYEIYSRIDLGPEGDAVGPATDRKERVSEIIRKKYGR